MLKIDGETVVPIGWVLVGFGTICSVVIVGCFWVSAVNFRLQRIEEKLGIPKYQTSVSLEQSAYSATSKQ